VNSKILIGWTTLPSEKEALSLAQGLVETRWAACVQVDGPIKSIFRWEGVVENAEEWRLVVKFPEEMGGKLAQWLAENHPYDEPQWIAIEADQASSSYAKWIFQETSSGNE